MSKTKGKLRSFWKIETKQLMLNDTSNVMTEFIAPKGPRFVEIIEIMDRPDIPFVKLILFAGLALPSWLRHILYNVFDSLPPVTEVMIFIPI